VLNIQQWIIFWSIVRCGRKEVHVCYLISWWVLVSFAAIFGIGKLESAQGYCVALFRAELKPNLAWVWCCSQKKALFSSPRSKQTKSHNLRQNHPLLNSVTYKDSSMVPNEIDIKLSAINSKVLNVLIARKETRRPCYRREPPRDVGHLYRKLAPDPLVAQWTERTLKLSETWGCCQKTTFQVYQWRTDACRRMVSRDLQIKVREIRGISCDWPHL